MNPDDYKEIAVTIDRDYNENLTNSGANATLQKINDTLRSELVNAEDEAENMAQSAEVLRLRASKAENECATLKSQEEYYRQNRETIAEKLTQLEKENAELNEKWHKQAVIAQDSLCRKVAAETGNQKMQQQLTALVAENTTLIERINDRKAYTDSAMLLSKQITEMQMIESQKANRLSLGKRAWRFINSL